MDFLSNFSQLFAPTAHGAGAAPVSGLYAVLFILKGLIAIIGTLVILTGVIIGAYQFCFLKLFSERAKTKGWDIEVIRRNLGLTIVLGLEFIIAADVVSTIYAPDYYSVGVLAIVVVIRTFLSYSLSREINLLTPKQQKAIKD